MVIEGPTYQLELEAGWVAVAEPLDAQSTETLSRRFSDATPGRVAVQVAPTDTFDVSGHAAGGATIDVILTIGDDVEGHAFSLRFPSPEDAQRMRTTLAAGGLLIAALTVGSIGVATQVAGPHTGTGAAAQAAPIAAPAPLTVSPALKADLRYPPRDQEVIVSVAPATSAVGANDRGKGGGESNTSSDVPTIPKN